MQTTRIGGKIKDRVYARHALIGSICATAIFLLTFLIAPYIIAEASASQAVEVGTNWVATSLTLDPDYGNGDIDDAGHGDVEFGEITPTSTTEDNYGTMRVIKKQIGIESSGQYFTVYLSMSGDSNALQFGGTDSNIRIDPVSGTWAVPSDFSDGTGWGFAVPGTTIASSGTTPSFTQASTFSDASNLGIDLTATGNASVYNQDTWVAVPVSGSAQQIWKATTTNSYGFGGENGDSTNNNFAVYYGVMVGSDVLAGTYSNEIVYTALASSKSLDEVSNNLLVSDRFVADGTTETLTFDVTLSTSGLIDPSQIIAYVVPHADALSGISTLETNEASYAICEGTGTDGALTSSDVEFGETGTTITCTMPDETPAWDGTNGTATDGLYDIWVTIPDYSANYISKTTATAQGSSTSVVASIVYAGLQSVEQNGTDTNGDPVYEPFVSTMQEMTSSVCANTNMWGSGIGAGGTDKDNNTLAAAQIYDYNGEDGNTVAKDSSGSNIAANTDVLGYSSFALTDSRDSKTYLVRRLADGNCWMVQNLDLNLADFAGTTTLTSANTDLNSKTSWDPSASLVAKVGSSTGTHSTIAATTTLDIELSTALANQYLYRGTSTTDLSSDLRRYWGSRFDADGNLYELTDTNASYDATTNPCLNGSTWDSTHSVCVANNINAEIPRSYDNGSDWVDQSSYATATGYTSEATVSGGHTRLAPETWDYNHATTYLGDYYNWYAATAESGTYSATSGNMEDSICPKGWRLPYNAANESGSWYDLLRNAYAVTDANGTQTESNNKYGTAQGPALAMHELPLSIVFSGLYNWVNGGLNNRGTNGNYWSSTPYASTNAHNLNFNSTNVNPQNGNNKTNGLTVRCVAR